MHAAICACKMYIQRGRDPTNKLVVGAGMPFDSRFQTVAKVQDNRIIGRYAGAYRKLDDSIGAMIVSQPIESSSRNEKAKTFGYVFGMGRRIKGQIDQTHRAMWEGDYSEAAFFRIANAEGISFQCQDDPVLG
jgi:hypothetical protein